MKCYGRSRFGSRTGGTSGRGNWQPSWKRPTWRPTWRRRRPISASYACPSSTTREVTNRSPRRHLPAVIIPSPQVTTRATRKSPIFNSIQFQSINSSSVANFLQFHQSLLVINYNQYRVASLIEFSNCQFPIQFNQVHYSIIKFKLEQSIQ